MIEISIIIPCYNSFHFMKNCLKSLENQTFKNFEVIFVDDCSNDNTFNELKKYLKNSIINHKIIRNDKNIGPGASRNKGIKVAQGKYISFMDSDDWYEDNFLELMYRNSSEENLDIIMCDYYRSYDNGRRKVMTPTKQFNGKVNKAEVLAKSFDSLCCMLIRREIFKNISIPNQFNAEDIAVIPVLICNSNNIGYISKPLYNYFYRSGSLSTNINENVDKDIIKAYNYILDNTSNDLKEEIEFIGIKSILYGAVVCAIQSKKGKKYINSIIYEFEKENPNWFKNKYFRYLPKSKKIFLLSVRYKSYLLLMILSTIRNILFRIKVA